ncbi:MAG: hypothetical protein K9H16_16335, partial [Bacteroidales bacterium]|nr:hypothetical protein [Bacteroidales bacterium]
MKKIFNTYKIFAIALMGLILMGSPVQKAAYAQSAPELEMVLEKLNEDYLEVTNAIPNRLDFSGGESGYYISYGNGMFWDGNYIST